MLIPRCTPGAEVFSIQNSWHLEIPAGEAGSYRLAQIDDYVGLSRNRFPLNTTSTLSLHCRVNEPNLPGTWGFGFWNDPFAFSFGLQGKPRRLPTLPNACWFFHASAENHLSFHNSFPGNGFLAQTFRSPKISSLLLAPGILGLPILFSKTLSRWLRAIIAKVISEDSLFLEIDETQWHAYSLSWRENRGVFSVDDAVVFETPVSPRGPLGVVIWIDNQYAAWTPEGRIGMGTLQQKAAGWMEIKHVEIKGEN